MPTTITKVVDTGGTGDYSSLAAWEAARQGNLVTADTIERALCKCTTGAADTGGQLAFSGWTVDATRYPLVYVDPDYRHKGVWDTSKYRMDWSGSDGVAQIAGMIYAYSIHGMQLKNTAASGKSAWCIWHNAGIGSASTVSIYNNILRGAGNAVATEGGIDIVTSLNTSGFYIYNNLMYDFTGTGYTSFAFRFLNPGYFYIYNNTAYNSTYGFIAAVANTAYLNNNIAVGCYDGFYGSWYSADYNCSDISGDATGANSRTGTPQFVAPLSSPRNLDLRIGDTVARNYGYPRLSEDIRGCARPYPSGGSHDIGCFEHTPISITAAESAHVHSVDNVSFTQEHEIVVQETGHGHTVDGNLSFTQLHIFVVQECFHAHSAENCDADVSIQLYVDDAFHSQSAEGDLVIHRIHNMVVQDALHSHLADRPRFTQLHIMVVQDGLQAHSAENCGANIWVNMGVQEASHGHTVDEDIEFTQEHNIVVQDAYMQITSTHGRFLGSQIRVVTSSTGARVVVLVESGRKVIDTTPARTVSLAE